MPFSFTTPISNAVTGVRNYQMKKLNAQELLKTKQEQVNDQKMEVAGIKAAMDKAKATDGITYRFLEDKLRCAERDLRILEKQLEQCRKEVHESKYQERKAHMSLIVENNGTQQAADIIMNDELAKMEAEFSSAAKKRRDP